MLKLDFHISTSNFIFIWFSLGLFNQFQIMVCFLFRNNYLPGFRSLLLNTEIFWQTCTSNFMAILSFISTLASDKKFSCNSSKKHDVMDLKNTFASDRAYVCKNMVWTSFMARYYLQICWVVVIKSGSRVEFKRSNKLRLWLKVFFIT